MTMGDMDYNCHMKATLSALSDTFQITGRQNDFRPNYRWVRCNYPFLTSYLLHSPKHSGTHCVFFFIACQLKLLLNAFRIFVK